MGTRVVKEGSLISVGCLGILVVMAIVAGLLLGIVGWVAKAVIG